MPTLRRHSTCLIADSFRYYFTGSHTLLFTFPSRYSFTIGQLAYLALERGRPSFTQEFAVSRDTQELARVTSGFAYETLTLFGLLFHGVWLPSINPISLSYNPLINQGLGCLRFARRLLRRSL